MLIGDQGLRTYQGDFHHSNAGFLAMAWKLEGDNELRRDLPVDFFGGAIARTFMKRKLLPKSAVLIEIGWPLTPPKTTWTDASARFVRCIGPSPDAEIQALEAMLRNPLRQHDTPLGRFTRDDQLAWVEGSINWLGLPASATMEAALDIDVAMQLPVLTRLLDEQQNRDAQIREAIVAGLYDLWCDNWRQDDAIVSPGEFASRMQVESIGIHRDGDFEVWLRDADFFWGHGVMVRGTLEGGFEPAEMHG